MSDNGPCYVTMHVRDLARAQTFFGQLFGWKFRPGNTEGGAIIENNSPPTGLHGGVDEPRAALFFSVPDIHAGLATVRAYGGTVDGPREDKSWWIADCVDDQGVRFSLMGPVKDEDTDEDE
jgi:predicted enzyme related to lactoylglutathione lyase